MADVEDEHLLPNVGHLLFPVFHRVKNKRHRFGGTRLRTWTATSSKHELEKWKHNGLICNFDAVSSLGRQQPSERLVFQGKRIGVRMETTRPWRQCEVLTKEARGCVAVEGVHDGHGPQIQAETGK